MAAAALPATSVTDDDDDKEDAAAPDTSDPARPARAGLADRESEPLKEEETARPPSSGEGAALAPPAPAAAF
jgi:hypothetical protein